MKVNWYEIKTYSVKTFDQLLVTQAVVCVKPGVKVLRRKKETFMNREDFPVNSQKSGNSFINRSSFI